MKKTLLMLTLAAMTAGMTVPAQAAEEEKLVPDTDMISSQTAFFIARSGDSAMPVYVTKNPSIYNKQELANGTIIESYFDAKTDTVFVKRNGEITSAYNQDHKIANVKHDEERLIPDTTLISSQTNLVVKGTGNSASPNYVTGNPSIYNKQELADGTIIESYLDTKTDTVYVKRDGKITSSYKPASIQDEIAAMEFDSE